MAMTKAGIQQNNMSPMGQGQPLQGKQVAKPKQKNFMEDAFGQELSEEPIAPGIPTAQMGSSLNVGQPNAPIVGSRAPNINGTLQQPQQQPVSQPAGVPQSFQGKGTGWRGLDINPVANTGVNQFAGFNNDRAFAGGDPNSTKDAFARWAAGFTTNVGGLDKSKGGALEQLLRSRLDEAKAMGLNITDIYGDKIMIDAKENEGSQRWVDVVENAGAAGSRFAWQPEDSSHAAPRTAPANDIYSQYQSQLMPQTQQTAGSSNNLDDLLTYLMSQNQEQI